MNKIMIAALCCGAFLLSCSCDKGNGPDNREPEVFAVSYTESDEDFCNPERGYYQQFTVRFADGNMPSPVPVTSLQAGRVAKRTLSLTLFYLTDFMDGDISDAALDVVRKSLQAHRDAGVKTVLRFAYKDGYAESDKPWDAPVDVVLRHVQQLSPIFHEYGDVIYVLQAGFVGAWGEWYYTDYFKMNPQNDEDWKPRIRLVRALLDAMPENRQVALRTAEYKRKFLGTETVDTITAATAFSTSDNARLAGHNDCFLSSSSDVGTFNSTEDREQWKADTQYASMGGETCAALKSFCNCEKSFTALQDYHWSYLNSGYHSGVFTIWRQSGCYDEISRRLGYRIVLIGANYGDSFAAGKEFSIDIKLKNAGFASFINPRDLEFVIASSSDPSEKYVIATDFDPRVWKGGKEYRYQTSIVLPSELESGKEYCLYMNLPDAAETLHDNPLFSVRLANENVWDEATGYNLLAKFTAE